MGIREVTRDSLRITPREGLNRELSSNISFDPMKSEPKDVKRKVKAIVGDASRMLYHSQRPMLQKSPEEGKERDSR